MNPYTNLPTHNFWKATFESPSALAVGFDYGRKFTFSAVDSFVTAGSCFAQHFAQQLIARGGNVLMAEQRHPLIPENCDHGYGLFSARYGNLYTVRQLVEMLEQAFGLREKVYEFARRKDGRWVDMLRPRAVPLGFSSVELACVDRNFHLQKVCQLVRNMNVFVFTLGLTEAWINIKDNYCYPVVPGSIAGDFSPIHHSFTNFTVAETVDDLHKMIKIIYTHNSTAKILLTVSPVGLVATVEPRSVIVSTTASKSILRAAIDEVVRHNEGTDYFPSYEIITSPYCRGEFWADGLRDVTENGVKTVMDIFFHSRMPDFIQNPTEHSKIVVDNSEEAQCQLNKAITEECDEMFLDPTLRSKT